MPDPFSNLDTAFDYGLRENEAPLSDHLSKLLNGSVVSGVSVCGGEIVIYLMEPDKPDAQRASLAITSHWFVCGDHRNQKSYGPDTIRAYLEECRMERS